MLTVFNAFLDIIFLTVHQEHLGPGEVGSHEEQNLEAQGLKLLLSVDTFFIFAEYCNYLKTTLHKAKTSFFQYLDSGHF